MKWFLIIVAAGVIFSIITDNMGGAQKATSNYNKLLNPR